MKTSNQLVVLFLAASICALTPSPAGAESRIVKNTFSYTSFTKSGRLCIAPGKPGQPSKAECSGHRAKVATSGELILRDDRAGVCMMAVVHGAGPALSPADKGRPHVNVRPSEYACDHDGRPSDGWQDANQPRLAQSVQPDD